MVGRRLVIEVYRGYVRTTDRRYKELELGGFSTL